MADVSNYNKINRFWGSNSVSAARKVDKSTGKSQKDSTCDKLNNLLRDHPDEGITVIKALVNFKKARDDSWFCAGRPDQSDQLSTIDNTLKQFDLSDLDNKYPTLKELEVLVKNSSYFVQRDIPTHFRDFLIKLDSDVKKLITDPGNQKFLQDNGIIDKPKSKTKSTIQRSAERAGPFSKTTDYSPKNILLEMKKNCNAVEFCNMMDKTGNTIKLLEQISIGDEVAFSTLHEELTGTGNNADNGTGAPYVKDHTGKNIDGSDLNFEEQSSQKSRFILFKGERSSLVIEYVKQLGNLNTGNNYRLFIAEVENGEVKNPPENKCIYDSNATVQNRSEILQDIEKIKQSSSKFNQQPKKNLSLFSDVSIKVEDQNDGEVGNYENNYMSSIDNINNINIERPEIANDIQKALFKVNSGENITELNPIELKLTKESFNDIKRYYISLIEESGSDYSDEYIEYLQKFDYALDDGDDIKLTIYPAYSKDTGLIAHNQSGDTSLQIESSNGHSTKFIFDAPSILDGMDWSALRCFDQDNYANDCQMAMHAKLLFLLHYCSKKDFMPDDEINSMGSNRLPNLAVALPYAWATTDQNTNTYKIMVNGDCNALIQYKNNLFPMAAGQVNDKDNPDTYVDQYKRLYDEYENAISTGQGLTDLQKLGENYSNSDKKLSSPEGGLSQSVTVQKKIEGSPVKIILVSDGATDNQKLLNELNSYINANGQDDLQFMQNTKEYMNNLDKNTESHAKKDDFATPLIVS